MPTRTVALLTGASGFIGGHILALLSENADFRAKADLYALVRQESQVVLVEALGFKAFICDLDDTARLEEQITKLGITMVMHTASSSVWAQQSAILNGIARSKATKAVDGYFLTIAGSDAFADTGGWDTVRQVSDLEDCFAQIEALSQHSKRQTIDLQVHNTASALGIYSWTIYTPTVYGRGRGFGHQFSINVPGLVRAAVRERKARYTNRNNLQPVVHVNDISNLWILIATKTLDGEAKTIPHGLSGGAYFAEIGSTTWKTFGDSIGEALYTKGLADSPEATAWPSLKAAAESLRCPLSWAGTVYGAHTNWSGKKARSIGWVPQYNLKHFLNHMNDEIESIIDAGEGKQVERIDLH